MIPPPPPVARLKQVRSKLLELPAGETFWRCNGTGHPDPLNFGKKACNRFDDPQMRYGVMYASFSQRGAMAETILHNQLDTGNADMFVPQSRFDAYWLAEITVLKTLHFIDFAEDHTRFGLSAAISFEVDPNNGKPNWTPYQTTMSWSEAIATAWPDVAGIAYRARHAGTAISLAFFERSKPHLAFRAKQLPINDTIRDYFLDATGHTLDPVKQ